MVWSVRKRRCTEGAFLHSPTGREATDALGPAVEEMKDLFCLSTAQQTVEQEGNGMPQRTTSEEMVRKAVEVSEYGVEQ